MIILYKCKYSRSFYTGILRKNRFCLGYINPFCFHPLPPLKNWSGTYLKFLILFFFNLLLDRRQEHHRLLTSIVSLASDLSETPLSCLIIDHPQPLKLYFNFDFLTYNDTAVASSQIKVIWGNSTGNRKRAGCIFGCNVLIESRWLQMQRPSAAGDTFLIF